MKTTLNQIFGSRTVIYPNHERKKGGLYSIVRCKCGVEQSVSNSAMYQGRANGCKNCFGLESRTVLPIGEAIGNWIVVHPNEKSNNGRWLTRVKCSCGNETLIRNSYLNSKRTNCCEQCRIVNVAKLLTRDDPWSCEANIISLHAKRRNLEFNLTAQDVKKLSMDNCVICGAIPYMKARSKAKNLTNVLRNGIDRLDSEKGYTKENCQTLCWNCNRWKGTLSMTEFRLVIDKLIRFQNSSKS